MLWSGWRTASSPTLAGWVVVGFGDGAGRPCRARRWPGPARGGLIALAPRERGWDRRAFPFTEATAPLASSLRNAPAALLAAQANRQPRPDPSLSLSDIRYDPGDLAELRANQADRLPPDAVERWCGPPSKWR